MGDLLQNTRDAIGLLEGKLIVGNHDSITLLGSQAQAKLREYSKVISSLFLSNNDELESAINDVIVGIEKFETIANKNHLPFLRFYIQHKELIKEYNRITAYIDQVTLFFQMQQAQLLKEVKLLEKLSATVKESTSALEKCIADGVEVLNNEPSVHSKYDSSLNSSNTTEDPAVWYSRLERKLDDLRISHTAALQYQAQIKILYNHNLILLDKITTGIFNTFPLWQNQIVMMLGIERLEKRLEAQDNVFKHLSDGKELNIKKITEQNKRLISILNETASLEKKDLCIRQEFQDVINHI